MKLDANQVVFVLRVEHKQTIRMDGVDVVSELEPSETASTTQEDLNPSQKNNFLYHLHDLRLGRQFIFVSWQEIQDYIKERTRQGLR